jgi:hypothetical protein
MQTSLGTSWTGIPSAADDLFYPSISFVGGEAGASMMLLLSGSISPGKRGHSVLIQFQLVELVMSFEEFSYLGSAQTDNRPENVINLINNSTTLDEARARTDKQYLKHMLLTGNSCCEIVCHPDFDVKVFPDHSTALDFIAKDYLDQASSFR